MSGVNIPTDSAHLSDLARTQMVEEYAGAVDSQFKKSSMMRRIVNVRSIRGTDTAFVRRAGKTTLQALTAGVRPAANATGFGKTSVTVDTVIIARDNRSLLNEFQTDFNARAELGKDHGKELGFFFDQAMLIQGIKAAYQSAPSGLNGAIGAGRNTALSALGDELDPDKLYDAIAGIIVEMEEDEVDLSEMVIFVRPTQYDILTRNDKLIDRDFSAENGDFASGRIGTIKDVPVVKTARIPRAAITGHFLSNTDNSNAYDVSAAEARTVALVMHPSALLAGETIPMTHDVFFSDIEKQWFIDSFMAFGVAPRRPDVAGVVASKAP